MKIAPALKTQLNNISITRADAEEDVEIASGMVLAIEQFLAESSID